MRVVRLLGVLADLQPSEQRKHSEKEYDDKNIDLVRVAFIDGEPQFLNVVVAVVGILRAAFVGNMAQMRQLRRDMVEKFGEHFAETVDVVGGGCRRELLFLVEPYVDEFEILDIFKAEYFYYCYIK